MCVICYVPSGETITTNNIIAMWETNPDGAGYAYQKNNKIYFKRGIMRLNNFIKEIENKIGKYNLLLHFRISTCAGVTKRGTHPYKQTNTEILKGVTESPLICMNGSIYNLKCDAGANDTETYINKYNECFKNPSNDLINLIESDTGAKWFIMDKNNVYFSEQMQELNGVYYSNLNHEYLNYLRNSPSTENKLLTEFIPNKKLRRKINKNTILKNNLIDFIQENCLYFNCTCEKCIYDINTLQEANQLLYNWWEHDLNF